MASQGDSELGAAVRRICEECLESRLVNVLRSLDAKEVVTNEKIEALNKQVEDIKTSVASGVNEKKRALDALQLDHLSESIKKIREEFEVLKGEVKDTKTKVLEVAADLPSPAKQDDSSKVVAATNNKIDQFSAQLDVLTNRINTANLAQLPTTVTRVNVMNNTLTMLTTKSTQFLSQCQQISTEMQALKQQQIVTSNDLHQRVQMVLSMCQESLQKAGQMLSNVDQSMSGSQPWEIVDLDSQENFDVRKVYRFQSNDGWMYSTVVNSNAVYFASTAANDQVVLVFSQSKRLPMCRGFGAALTNVINMQSGVLQCRA